mmetsp:Transcript_125237/g.389868  ORF Transcript_125237/g.389868 Transcript_125237/m.389868 type:complete len:384 (+) Transcript_125237:146-1297(+)
MNTASEAHHLSLRFRSSSAEDAFVVAQTAVLARNACRLGLAAGAAFGALLVWSLAEGMTPASGPAQSWSLAASAACASLCCLPAVVAGCPAMVARIGPRMQEGIVAGALLLLAALQCLLGPLYKVACATTLAEDDSGSFSACGLVLVLATFVVVSHFVLPIRWMYLAPLEVILGPMYLSSALFTGSKARQAWVTFALLELLIVVATFGRRTVESMQRATFWQMWRERSLRQQVEIELSKCEEGALGGQQHDEAWRRETSGASSRAEFEVPDISTGSQSLRRFISLGRKEHWYIDREHLWMTTKVLGAGNFGAVIAGEYLGSPVAVKVFRTPINARKQSDQIEHVMSMLNEVRILRRIHHPNIVMYSGACLDEDGGGGSTIPTL